VRPAVLARILWVLAGFAVVLALARDPLLGLIPAPRELPRFDGRSGVAWVEGGFGPQFIPPGLLPPHIHHVSSWVGSDAWQGRSESAWFKANRRLIHVGVAGHPRLPGCSLRAEFQFADGSIRRVACRIPNPNTEWSVWEISTPAGAVAVRIVGEDRSSDALGWIAFSHPFRAWPGWIAATYQAAQLVATFALVLVLVWAPGLVLAPRVAPVFRLPVLLGTGPLLLAAAGVLLWSLSPGLPVGPAGTLLVVLAWAALARPFPRACATLLDADRPLRLAFAVAALVALAAVAKSTYSVGPPGELFRGTVSRNLALGDRIDSRFNYYTVQAAYHGFGPASPQTEGFFYPWTFFSRGPLSGLAAIPVVAATQGLPRDVLPEHRWSPFDRTGFAAYRVTLVVLAGAIVVAVALGLAPVLGPSGALLAAGLVALTPFGVHEVMFTWPKWTATAWSVAAFALAHQRRPALAGLALGVGFLFHPLTLLWAPWIGLWAGFRAWHAASRRRFIALVRAGAACTGGTLVLVGPWMLLGEIMPHLPTTPFAGQSGFVRYWTLADWHIATWETWWRTRWQNFANTFIPLHLVLDPTSFAHPKLGSAYEESTRFAKSAQLWWNTLPFGLGLGLWLAGTLAAARALRRTPSIALLFLVVPALFLVAYWGMDPVGLLRECGHPLFVTVIAFLGLETQRPASRLGALVAHPAVPWLQLPETLLMLWLTTLANPQPPAGEHIHLDPFYLALNVLALAAAALLLSRARTALPNLAAPAATAPNR
jgi:hypothetical protein